MSQFSQLHYFYRVPVQSASLFLPCPSSVSFTISTVSQFSQLHYFYLVPIQSASLFLACPSSVSFTISTVSQFSQLHYFYRVPVQSASLFLPCPSSVSFIISTVPGCATTLPVILPFPCCSLFVLGLVCRSDEVWLHRQETSF